MRKTRQQTDALSFTHVRRSTRVSSRYMGNFPVSNICFSSIICRSATYVSTADITRMDKNVI
jgi:hypothetical protein